MSSTLQRQELATIVIVGSMTMTMLFEGYKKIRNVSTVVSVLIQKRIQRTGYENLPCQQIKDTHQFVGIGGQTGIGSSLPSRRKWAVGRSNISFFLPMNPSLGSHHSIVTLSLETY